MMPSMETLYGALLTIADGRAQQVEAAIPSHDDGMAEASDGTAVPGSLDAMALSILQQRGETVALDTFHQQFANSIPVWLWGMALSSEIRDPLRELAQADLCKAA